MRRSLVLVVILLVFGALLNVIVAWTFCILGQSQPPIKLKSHTVHDPSGVFQGWPTGVPSAVPDPTHIIKSAAIGTTYIQFSHADPAIMFNPGYIIPSPREVDPSDRRLSWRILRAGFPLRALEAQAFFDETMHATASIDPDFGLLHHPVEVDWGPVRVFGYDLRAGILPIRPMLFGFIGNTLMYAAVMALLVLSICKAWTYTRAEVTSRPAHT